MSTTHFAAYRVRLALTCTGLLLAILIAATAARAEVSLPAPNDIPCGVEGVPVPGGESLPTMAGTPTDNGPAISAVNDECLPDETLAITGDHLAGARLRVWMEGRVEGLEPVRSAANRMVAVLPKEWPASTMLIWPVRDEQAGRPIRVNGTTLWWAWPARIVQQATPKPTTALLMGRNLKFGAAEPKVYLKGPGVGQWLKVLSAKPYQLEVELPENLEPATYQLFAHNGMAGRFGWSEPASIDVVPAPVQGERPVFDVAGFGAKPDDGQDDAPAIQKAIDEAVKSGGGEVRFSAGRYHLAAAIRLPDVATGGVHLTGAGMGGFDAAAQSVTGSATVLQFMPGIPLPDCLVQIDCRFSSVRDLTILGGHEGVVRGIHDFKARRQWTARVTQSDVTLERVRLVMLDLRPDVPLDQRQNLQIFDPALHVDFPGRTNLLVQDCEFHSAGAGINIGDFQRGHMEGDTKADAFQAPSSDFVRVEHCTFRGYAQIYKGPLSENCANLGCLSEGISILNGKQVIVQRCDFAGADRRGGKMMNRSILAYNSSIRNVFLAENASRDVGMVCPREDQIVNQGEQICFHFCYPHGGYFDVLEADSAHVAVNPSDPRNVGTMVNPHIIGDRGTSRVLEEVGANDHWIAFVSAGKGAGQYRVVTGADRRPDRVLLRLDRPWRVVPDATSRVTLTVAYRQNIIVDNAIDSGFIDPRSKTAGILFWYNAFDNIIAGNRLRNLGYGIGFNASFRNPCCWNLVRDNVMEKMGGISMECLKPTFYFDTCGTAGGPTGPLFQPGSDVAGWYSLGNVAKGNQGRDAPVGAFAHSLLQDDAASKLPDQDEAGIMMPVLEHNRFTGVQQGIVVNRATVWPVIRDNSVETVEESPEAPK